MLNHNTVDKLRSALVGRIITRVKNGPRDSSRLILDDGTIVEFYESEQDCCAYAWSEINDTKTPTAIITDLKITNEKHHTNTKYGGESSATLTILAENQSVANVVCGADDGNGGYYFSVLSVRITAVNGTKLLDETLLSS